MNNRIDDEPIVEGQHVNPDGETDAKKGAKLGGAGGAITGALAGAAAGPGGAILGAVIGGLAGAVASGAAVAAVDRVDGDDSPGRDRGTYTGTSAVPPIIDNGIPGVQTGGRTVDGSMDTRGITEKMEDAVTGDNIDDKTGKRVSGMPPIVDNGIPGIQTGGRANDGTRDTRGVSEKLADAVTGDTRDDKTGKRVG